MPGLSHINIPLWLERNYLFRKLFLLRKLFLTRLTFSHYAGNAEDEAVARQFKNDFYGFFVDVGCYHPIKYNNTWKLYKRGWRGINIDLDDIKIELFNMVRGKDLNLVRAISDKEGVVDYFKSGLFSQINSIDPAYAKKINNQYSMRKVACTPLTKLLDSTRFRDRKIDFLNVDAEGHDLKVLKSLDFKRYAPSVIAVEIHAAGFSTASKHPIYQFLKKKNYELVSWCGETLVFASKQHLNLQ